MKRIEKVIGLANEKSISVGLKRHPIKSHRLTENGKIQIIHTDGKIENYCSIPVCIDTINIRYNLGLFPRPLFIQRNGHAKKEGHDDTWNKPPDFISSLVKLLERIEKNLVDELDVDNIELVNIFIRNEISRSYFVSYDSALRSIQKIFSNYSSNEAMLVYTDMIKNSIYDYYN